MAHHQQRHALCQQRAENFRELLLKFRVEALGRLVQQENFRLQKQHLGQRGPLLLAAGEIIGVAIQQRVQTAQLHHPGHPLLLLGLRQLAAGENFKQVLPDGFLYKQCLRVLGQHAQRAGHRNIAPIGLFQPAQQLQCGAFACAVAAQQRQKLAPAQLEIKALYYVGTVLLIAEPSALHGDDRLTLRLLRLLWKRQQGLTGRELLQKIPPLPHGDGAGRVGLHRRPDAHGGRHGQKHPVPHGLEVPPHFRGRSGTQKPPAVHHRHGGGQWEGFF